MRTQGDTRRQRLRHVDPYSLQDIDQHGVLLDLVDMACGRL